VANEVTVTAALSFFKPSIMSTAIGRAVAGLQFSVAGTTFVEGSVLIGTSATAIPLGQVTAPHWAFFNNLDAVNYLTIRNGSGGTDLIKLLAGEPAFVPLLDTAVPYAVANTASIQLEYLIISL
jgi:hypothetical protein